MLCQSADRTGTVELPGARENAQPESEQAHLNRSDGLLQLLSQERRADLKHEWGLCRLLADFGFIFAVEVPASLLVELSIVLPEKRLATLACVDSLVAWLSSNAIIG